MIRKYFPGRFKHDYFVIKINTCETQSFIIFLFNKIQKFD